MRFVIHTPRTHVAEWDITGLAIEASDAEVLEQLTPATRRPDVKAKRISASTMDVEPPFVFARFVVTSNTDDVLEAAAKRVRAARAVEEAAMESARELAVAAMDAGEASERQVSATFGVDRNTVRAWRGKAR